MPVRQTVFSQLIDRIHPQLFARCVRRYNGERKVRQFSCWDQFLCPAFAQLTYRESLRDIGACLRSRGAQLYHLGFRSPISRSTLADANETRDWRSSTDLAQALMVKARRAYAQLPLECGLQESVYALDSSTIDFCLSLFPWAGYSRTQAGIKLHTLLDLRGAIPSFLHITDAKSHDLNALDWLLSEPDAFYVMDRGYVDFGRLYRLHAAPAFFVVRARGNLRFVRNAPLSPCPCCSLEETAESS